MIIVQHRVNTTLQLNATPTNLGVECDLRDKYNEIILQHDAYTQGENVQPYLDAYNHNLLIANVKTEGIEQQLINEIEKRRIPNYFLLDVSLPYLVKLSSAGYKHLAVRYSEYEPLEFALRFVGKVNWVWVDCFTHLPLNTSSYTLLKTHFKLCLVSPELQGHNISEIANYRQLLLNMPLDAVCTKMPSLWT